MDEGNVYLLVYFLKCISSVHSNLNIYKSNKLNSNYFNNLLTTLTTSLMDSPLNYNYLHNEPNTKALSDAFLPLKFVGMNRFNTPNLDSRYSC